MKNQLLLGLSILILSTLLFSCKSAPDTSEEFLPLENEEAIFAVWKRVEVKENYKNETQEKLAKENPYPYERTYFVALFPDGKGSVSFKTELDSLRWMVKSTDEIELPEQMKGTVIKLLRSGKDTLLKVYEHEGFTEMTFEKYSNLTTDFEEDPFYPNNNLWRTRAKRTISDAQIASKVDNYLKHYELLFKAALDKKSQRSFTNKYSQGVLRVYKSAIGTVKKENISEDWYSYFYNEKEALKAYEMVKERVKNVDQKFEKSGDWIADNYQIMKAINN